MRKVLESKFAGNIVRISYYPDHLGHWLIRSLPAHRLSVISRLRGQAPTPEPPTPPKLLNYLEQMEVDYTTQ